MKSSLKARLKELEDIIETIPSPDGWLSEESKETFIAQSIRLAEKGFTNEEIYDILASLYEAVIEDFELGIEEVDQDELDDGEGWKKGYEEKEDQDN